MITVEITSLLEYYGDEATEEDASNFFEFCERYTAEHYGDEVEVVSVDGHPRDNAEARQINEEMWQAWLRHMQG